MPALPAEIIFQTLSKAFGLSQDYSRDEVLRRQTRLLERLIRHANEHVPFYRDSQRLKPLFLSRGAFDMAGWADVPVLTRNEAKANEDALHARAVPPDMGALETRMTSGSTGTPLRFRQTSVQIVASEVLVNRVLQWHRKWPIHRMAMSTGQMTASFPMPGMLKLPSGIPLPQQVELLRSARTTHVIIKPSLAAGWADVASSDDLPDLDVVMVTGEMLLAEVRRKIEKNLGVKVINLYSTSELGPIASEGPDGRMRVNEENLYLEGPPNTAPAQDLTPVVVTPFYAFGTPLIRYLPGDYVRFSSAKGKEAKGLRRLEDVIGRRRNLFRQPDGALFSPNQIRTAGLASILDHREWQLVQTSLNDIALRIVVPTPPRPDQWSALESYVKAALPRHNTSVVQVDRIDNDMKSGKAFDVYLSLIDSPA